MATAGNGGLFGIRPAQTSRRIESEATEHKLPVAQTYTGALALCAVVVAIIAVLALVGLPVVLSVMLAFLGARIARRVWITDAIPEGVALFGVAVVFSATLAAVVSVVADVSAGAWLLETLRPLWLPVWFVSNEKGDWLVWFGHSVVPFFGAWTRGALAAMLTGVVFFFLNLAYRMAIEVFNPNWPPTFTAALAEAGPFWWTWEREGAKPQTVVKEIRHVAEFSVGDDSGGVTHFIREAPPMFSDEADFPLFQSFCRGALAGNPLTRSTWEVGLGQYRFRKLMGWLRGERMVRKGAGKTDGYELTAKGRAYLSAFLEPGE